MSFIHKMLDRASRHTTEEKRRSFFGFNVTNSKEEKPKMEVEESSEKSALTPSIHTSGKIN